MAQVYTFDTVLLSAAKTGTPNLLTSTLSNFVVNTALSSYGVSAVSLSTNDVGITYNVYLSGNTLRTLTGTLSTTTILGSVFKIDTGYHNTQMAVVTLPVSNVQTYNVFTYLSSSATVAASALSTTDSVSTPDTRRKYLYGYV